MPTSTLRSNASGQIAWRTTSNWTPASVPVNGYDIAFTGGSQFWFDFTTGGVVDFTTGPTFSITSTSTNPSLTYGVGSIASGTGSVWGNSTSAIIRLAAGTAVTVNFSNLATPTDYASAGAIWLSSVTNTVYAEKYGNGYLALPGAPATSTQSNLSGVWNVWGGSLVFRTDTGSTSAGNNLNGNGTRISASDGTTGTRTIYGGLYVRGNNCVVGKYWDQGGTWNYTLNFSSLIQFIDTGAITGDVMTFSTSGASVRTAALCGSSEGTGDFGAFTINKAGDSSLTVTGAAIEPFFNGTLTCTGGSIIFQNVNGAQFADFTSHSSITFAANSNIGAIKGDGITVSSNVAQFGHNSRSTTLAGTGWAGTGGTLTKVGTGTFTLTPTSAPSPLNREVIIANGSIVVSSAVATAFGRNDKTATVSTGATSGTLTVNSAIDKSNTFLTISGSGYGGAGAINSTAAGARTLTVLGLVLGANATALAADAGATLTIASAAGQFTGSASIGPRKIGAGTVILDFPDTTGYNWTATTTIDAGTLGFNNKTLTNKPITLNGSATLSNAKLSTGCSLTFAAASTPTIEAQVDALSFNAPTVQSGVTLTLTGNPTSGSRVKVLGTTALTVNGTLKIGAGTQQRKMAYGGNLTFGNNATLTFA